MATKKFERFSTHTGTVQDFISNGFSEIESVGEELREAYDNVPDSLKETDVNCRRDEAASDIESMQEPDVNSSVLGELSCTTSIDNGKVYRGRQTQSRACRCNNGASQLRAAADAIREWHSNTGEAKVEEDPDQPDKWYYAIADVNSDISYDSEAQATDACEAELGYSMDDHNEAYGSAEELADACEEIADTAESLDIPGMFG